MNAYELAPLRLLIRGFGGRVPGGARISLHFKRPISSFIAGLRTGQAATRSFVALLMIAAVDLGGQPEHPGDPVGGLAGDFPSNMAVGVHRQRVTTTQSRAHSPATGTCRVLGMAV